MQGNDETSGWLSSYVDLEARIPACHPLRKIRQVEKGGAKFDHGSGGMMRLRAA